MMVVSMSLVCSCLRSSSFFFLALFSTLSMMVVAFSMMTCSVVLVLDVVGVCDWCMAYLRIPVGVSSISSVWWEECKGMS